MIKELAELRKDARPQPGAEDEKYSGIAAHPLARRWLRRCLADEMQAAMAAGPGEQRDQHHRRVAEIRQQLTADEVR